MVSEWLVRMLRNIITMLVPGPFWYMSCFSSKKPIHNSSNSCFIMFADKWTVQNKPKLRAYRERLDISRISINSAQCYARAGHPPQAQSLVPQNVGNLIKFNPFGKLSSNAHRSNPTASNLHCEESICLFGLHVCLCTFAWVQVYDSNHMLK